MAEPEKSQVKTGLLCGAGLCAQFAACLPALRPLQVHIAGRQLLFKGADVVCKHSGVPYQYLEKNTTHLQKAFSEFWADLVHELLHPVARSGSTLGCGRTSHYFARGCQSGPRIDSLPSRYKTSVKVWNLQWHM